MSTATLTRAGDPMTTQAAVAAGLVDHNTAAFLAYVDQIVAGIRAIGADLKATHAELDELTIDRAIAGRMLRRSAATGHTASDEWRGVRAWLIEVRTARRHHQARRDELARRIADLVNALPHAA